MSRGRSIGMKKENALYTSIILRQDEIVFDIEKWLKYDRPVTTKQACMPKLDKANLEQKICQSNIEPYLVIYTHQNFGRKVR